MNTTTFTSLTFSGSVTLIKCQGHQNEYKAIGEAHWRLSSQSLKDVPYIAPVKTSTSEVSTTASWPFFFYVRKNGKKRKHRNIC